MGALLLVLSFFAIASLFQYERMKQSNQRLGLVNDLFMPFSRQVAQIQSNLQTLSDDMRRFYFGAQGAEETGALHRMGRDLYPFVIQKKLARAAEILAENNTHDASVKPLVDALERIQKEFQSFLTT
ncbi:hypothetical protein EBR78_11650, partial [bacterium]|nr:hypothetical protein [bacterium]